MSAGLLLSLALLAGRLTGFVRELVLASSLGLSYDADVAIVLLTVPDLLVNLLLSGGLSVALIPVFRNANGGGLAALFIKAAFVVMGVFTLIGLVVVLVPGLWFKAMAPGLEFPPSLEYSSALYGLGLALPLTALAGVTAAALNSRNNFFVAGCGTLIFNVCIIAALYISPSPAVLLQMVCWGILVGAFIRLLTQMAALPSPFWSFEQNQKLLTRNVAQAFSAGLLASSLLVLVPTIVRAGASTFGEGQIATISYAMKLVEFPVGVLVTSLAVVIYPELCRLHDAQRPAEAISLLRLALQKALIYSLAVMVTGVFFADSLTVLLFQRGGVTYEDAIRIAGLVQVMLLGIPFIAISSLVSALLNSRNQPGLVMLITLLGLLGLGLSCKLAMYLGSLKGLALTLPGFYLLFAVFLVRFAGVSFWGPQGLVSRQQASILIKVAVGALLMVGLAHLPDRPSDFLQSLFAAVTFVFAAGIGHFLIRRQINTEVAK